MMLHSVVVVVLMMMMMMMSLLCGRRTTTLAFSTNGIQQKIVTSGRRNNNGLLNSAAATALITNTPSRGGGATATTKLLSTTATTTTTEEDESQATTTMMETTESSSSSSSSSYYKELVTKLETITQLSRAQSVLGYDQQVFMPAKAALERGSQMAALATVVHNLKTDPKLFQLMEQASTELEQESNSDNNNNNNNKDDKDALRLLELEMKSFKENERVSSELAAKAASLSASAYQDWITAKDESDYTKYIPTLQDCFDTAIAISVAKQGSSDDNIYDHMLDDFEMGMNQRRIDTIFEQVQDALIPLIGQVLKSKTQPSKEPLEGKFDLQSQQKVSELIVKAIGFDTNKGRIDVSVHPFTSSMSSNDVRITSRFRDDEWYQGLAGTIHEGGHAIYEQNLVGSLSIDSALSMGTHESQSLFWERHIGLSKPFWKWATPILQKTFHENGEFDNYTHEEIYGAVNAVTQSLIRVEADELTYPLHVILRYNIEKDVMSGNLNVSDINDRWNSDMKSMLDITVPNDSKGVLQDVHWSALAFGYFPTYLIGAIASAQLYYYCQKDIIDIESKIELGQFDDITSWLTNKVHRHGKRYESLDEMFDDQLGEALNPKYFIDYLTNKYTDLYQL